MKISFGQTSFKLTKIYNMELYFHAIFIEKHHMPFFLVMLKHKWTGFILNMTEYITDMNLYVQKVWRVWSMEKEKKERKSGFAQNITAFAPCLICHVACVMCHMSCESYIKCPVSC